MLEIGIDAIGIDATANEGSESVDIQVVGGNILPLAMPGTQEPMRIPSTVVNYSLSKEAALEYAALLKEEAEKLPDEKVTNSGIIQANDMRAVEQLAKIQEGLTGKR